MNSLLSEEEKEFLEKYEQRKQKHRASQQAYRISHQEQIKQYNKIYQENIKRQRDEINKKLMKADLPPPAPISVAEISKPPKIDKRTRHGKRQVQHIDIQPSYETRTTALEPTSITDYISKANILNKHFNNRPLPQPVKAELRKLFNDNKALDEDLIMNEMGFIKNDIEKTINTIRQIYKNDNSFKAYINILAVITSHFKNLNNVYQVYSKLSKKTNLAVQEHREENQIDEGDENKIIDVGDEAFNKNVGKLNKIEDILIYGLYILFPARRLDYKNMMIISENDTSKLDGINYLTLSSPKMFVFNQYKTDKTYGKQIFEIPTSLDVIINKYIHLKGLKSGDYLFSLERNKKEAIAESNFSSKVSNVFNKVYDTPVSVRFIRMSWASSLYTKNPTVKQIKELAYMMALNAAHSPDESRKYNKLFKN